MLGGQPVRMFLILYGRSDRWRLLLSTNIRLSFVDALEPYQVRWNIEVLFKESHKYLGLGGAQSRDFDAQVANATLCFISYIVLALDKQFSEYETMGPFLKDGRRNCSPLPC